MNGQVTMFTKQQLESGNLRYLHHGSKNTELGDWFSVNFTTTEYETYGPFRFEIDFIESTQVSILCNWLINLILAGFNCGTKY
jgi:hypothetical protein